MHDVQADPASIELLCARIGAPAAAHLPVFITFTDLPSAPIAQPAEGGMP